MGKKGIKRERLLTAAAMKRALWVSLRERFRTEDAAKAWEERKEGLEETILLAERQLAQKDGDRPGFCRFLARQFRFTGIRIWLCQFALLAGSCLLFGILSGQGWALWRGLSARRTALAASLFSILLAMVSLSFGLRAFRCGMWEIETVSYYSLSGILAADLLFSGSGSLCLLAVVYVAAVRGGRCPGERALLYLLFPFLCAVCLGLFLQRYLSPERLRDLWTGICAAVPVGIVLLDSFAPRCFEQAFSGGWAVSCAALAIVGAVQFLCLLRDGRPIPCAP